jgi:hypothetical protein
MVRSPITAQLRPQSRPRGQHHHPVAPAAQRRIGAGCRCRRCPRQPRHPPRPVQRRNRPSHLGSTPSSASRGRFHVRSGRRYLLGDRQLADHATLEAPRAFRALGAHGRATSETGFTLDRTQHDLVGRLGAENAPLTGTRFRCDWQMTRDLWIMPFAKGQHMRAARPRSRDYQAQ